MYVCVCVRTDMSAQDEVQQCCLQALTVATSAICIPCQHSAARDKHAAIAQRLSAESDGTAFTRVVSAAAASPATVSY